MNEWVYSRVVRSLSFLAALTLAGLVHADERDFHATLTGAQEVVVDDDDVFVPGGTDTNAVGRVRARFDAGFTQVRVAMQVERLTGSFTAAHFHCARPGQNGPVAFGIVNPGRLEFDGSRIGGVLTNADFAEADCVEVIGRPVNNIAALAFAMRDGLIYANVHTDMFPAGEIRGQMRGDDDDDLDDDFDDDDFDDDDFDDFDDDFDDDDDDDDDD